MPLVFRWAGVDEKIRQWTHRHTRACPEKLYISLNGLMSLYLAEGNERIAIISQTVATILSAIDVDTTNKKVCNRHAAHSSIGHFNGEHNTHRAVVGFHILYSNRFIDVNAHLHLRFVFTQKTVTGRRPKQIEPKSMYNNFCEEEKEQITAYAYYVAGDSLSFSLASLFQRHIVARLTRVVLHSHTHTHTRI